LATQAKVFGVSEDEMPPAASMLLWWLLQAAAFLPKPQDEDFDWEGDRPLETPLEDLVIYEMHVRGRSAEHMMQLLHGRPRAVQLQHGQASRCRLALAATTLSTAQMSDWQQQFQHNKVFLFLLCIRVVNISGSVMHWCWLA
jgi:hypothetical protein